MNNVVTRVKSPSPEFFINLRWVAGLIGTAAVAVNNAFELPAGWEVALDIVGYTASGSWLTSFLPKK